MCFTLTVRYNEQTDDVTVKHTVHSVLQLAPGVQTQNHATVGNWLGTWMQKTFLTDYKTCPSITLLSETLVQHNRFKRCTYNVWNSFKTWYISFYSSEITTLNYCLCCLSNKQCMSTRHTSQFNNNSHLHVNQGQGGSLLKVHKITSLLQ